MSALVLDTADYSDCANPVANKSLNMMFLILCLYYEIPSAVLSSFHQDILFNSALYQHPYQQLVAVQAPHRGLAKLRLFICHLPYTTDSNSLAWSDTGHSF